MLPLVEGWGMRRIKAAAMSVWIVTACGDSGEAFGVGRVMARSAPDEGSAGLVPARAKDRPAG